jgi:hypothetical protein
VNVAELAGKEATVTTPYREAVERLSDAKVSCVASNLFYPGKDFWLNELYDLATRILISTENAPECATKTYQSL